VAREQTLEAERPLLKAGIAARLLGTENPQTGKPHSASSADGAAALDEEYVGHCAAIVEATRTKLIAQGAYEAARLRARLAVAEVEALGRDLGGEG
jgi:hypothetical protein